MIPVAGGFVNKIRVGLKAIILILVMTAYSSFGLIQVGLEGVQTEVWSNNAVNNSGWGYHEYLPVGYDSQPGKSWPLILNLHGAGGWGNGKSHLVNVSTVGWAGGLKNNTKEMPAVVITPQSTGIPNTSGEWWPQIKTDKFIDWVCENYKIDRSRIYVVGLSMGGGGTWDIGKVKSHQLAGLIPICGSGTPELYDAYVTLPVYATHNDGDGTVPVSSTYSYINGISNAGGFPLMKIYASSSHDAWSATYGDRFFENWLLKQGMNTCRITNISVYPSACPRNQNTPITITLKAWSTATPINQVWLNLKTVNGPKKVAMTPTGGSNFTYTYSVPSGLNAGLRNVGIRAFDSSTNQTLRKVVLNIIDPVALPNTQPKPTGVAASAPLNGVNLITWNNDGKWKYRVYCSKTGPISDQNKGSAILLASNLPAGTTSYQHTLMSNVQTDVSSKTPFWYAVTTASNLAGGSWLAITNRFNDGGPLWGDWFDVQFGSKTLTGKTHLKMAVKLVSGNFAPLTLALSSGSDVKAMNYGIADQNWSILSIPLTAFGSPATTTTIRFKNYIGQLAIGVDDIQFTDGTVSDFVYSDSVAYTWAGATGGTVVQSKVFTTGGYTTTGETPILTSVNATVNPVTNLAIPPVYPPAVIPSRLSFTTNKPFSVSLSVDKDSGYWSTNGRNGPYVSFTAMSGAVVSISHGMTLYYYGKDVSNTSSTNSQVYTFDLLAPTANVSKGSFVTNKLFTLGLSVNENWGYWSTNGKNGPYQQYSTTGTTIPISLTRTVHYFGRDRFGNTSTTNSATYSFPPTVSVSKGSSTTNQAFTLVLTVDGNHGYWSTNGSAGPYVQFTAPNTALLIKKNTTIHYFGKDVAQNSTGTNSQTYLFDYVAPVVNFSHTPGMATNNPFILQISSDEDYGYWATNRNGPYNMLSSSAVVDVPIIKTTKIFYFGRDVLGNRTQTNLAYFYIEKENTGAIEIHGNLVQVSKGKSSTTVYIQIQENGSDFGLEVYSPKGTLVRSFGKETLDRGIYRKEWDLTNDAGKEVASGTYMVVVQVNGKRSVEKVMVIK